MKTTTSALSDAEIIKRMRELAQPNGFSELYFKKLVSANSAEAAYILTEQEYEEYFGRRKYSSFDSFRVVHNKKLKNK